MARWFRAQGVREISMLRLSDVGRSRFEKEVGMIRDSIPYYLPHIKQTMIPLGPILISTLPPQITYLFKDISIYLYVYITLKR